MYVLDTNVVSELRRERPHGAVVAWLNGLDITTITVSATTIGEIQVGIERTRDHDPIKAIEIEGWLEDLLHRIPVLSIDAETVRIWARLMHRKPQQLSEDAMIAATALRNGYIVATRNARDFSLFDVSVVNPFEAGRDA